MSDSALWTRRCTVLSPVLRRKRMLRCNLRTGVFLSLQQQRKMYIFQELLIDRIPQWSHSQPYLAEMIIRMLAEIYLLNIPFFIFSSVLRMTFLFYIKDGNIRLKYYFELELILLLFRLFRGWRGKGHHVAVLIESASTTRTGNTNVHLITSLDLSVIKRWLWEMVNAGAWLKLVNLSYFQSSNWKYLFIHQEAHMPVAS